MLKLYTSQICPYAHRARLVLSAKGIEHERVEIDLRDMPRWYRELSPNQSVPLLVHDDRVIPESLIIMQYLDEEFGGLKLTPEDAYGRARLRLALEAVGSRLVGKILPAFKNADPVLPPDSELWAGLEEGLDEEGPFWLGSRLTLVDLAAYPWFERWPLIEQSTGRKLNLPPRLKRWLNAVSTQPAVLKEARPSQFYLDYFAAPSLK